MSEDKVEYKPRGELKFVRLRTIPDDIIGYVTYLEETILIGLPLRVDVETIFEEGRQILAMQEYLPQSIINIQEVEFYMDEVLFVTPVRPEFVEQYEYVSDFFYNNKTSKEFSNKKNKLKIKSEETQEKVEKVVSILEAMANKKDKPIH
jgi:hypothetical protein